MKNYLNQTDKTVEDELHDECGVFGAYDFDGNDVASTIYYGLFALQHPDCEQLPNKKVRLINSPEQLLTLADLVNLSHWISTFIDQN